MFTPTLGAISAVRGLLTAYLDSDLETWVAVLGAQQDAESPVRPYEAFVALSALAASLALSVSELTESDARDVIERHTAAISGLLLDDDNQN